jgi:hypothetical protein
MESYLAGRSKVQASDLPTAADASAAGTAGLGGMDLFGGGISPGTGFQSLRDALLEVGSVVDPSDVHKAHGSGEGHVGRGEPSVEAITSNGRVEKIVVTCSCGEKIEIECCY